MSRFYAEIQGNRGMASRQGTKSSGIWSHTRGWNIGVEVQCYVGDDGKDHIRVYRTGGSSGHWSKQIIAVLEE